MSRCFKRVWWLLHIFWNGITIKWMASLLIKDSSEERTSKKENVTEDVWMRRCNAGKWMAWARPGVRDLKSKQLRKTGQAVLNLRLAWFAEWVKVSSEKRRQNDTNKTNVNYKNQWNNNEVWEHINEVYWQC